MLRMQKLDIEIFFNIKNTFYMVYTAVDGNVSL
jgi:hypothetical protein